MICVLGLGLCPNVAIPPRLATEPGKPGRNPATPSAFVRVGFWQNGFFADFSFWAAGFFRDFVAGLFLLIFVGKKCQKNPPGKSPAKSSKIYTTKIPDTFLQRGRANM